MTYSIVGYDPQNKEWGVAVQSKFLAVGALVPWVKAGVGAVATQAKTNAGFGEQGLELLEEGFSAEEVVKKFVADDSERAMRQIGVIDRKGNTASYTGEKCIQWAGDKSGDYYTCQGNVLLGSAVLEALATTFETTDGDLADRLLAALKSAQDAGGERRGRQSAALLVQKDSAELFGATKSYIDLRVDDALAPLEKLNRLLEKHRIQYAPNHKDKYYRFAGETRQQLITVLRELKIINSTLQEGETVEEVIWEYGLKKGFAQQEIFKGKLINGELVNQIMEEYYQLEYDQLSWYRAWKEKEE